MSIISSNHRLVKVEGSEYSAGPGIVIEDSTISVDPNLSALIDNKLDTSSFSSYSATIDDELQYVSANAGNTYSAGDNIDIYEQDNDLYISAKDWTTDIANASSYAFNEATAQIPPVFDPTYMSGQIDTKLNKSDFDTYSGSVNTQISGLSGEFQTTSSLLDNKITAVRHDLNTVTTNTGYLHTDIQTTSGILSAAIDYVSANAGDEFPASANDAITAYQTYSGTYLTAHQDISNKLDTTAFSTVSGTFLTAHQDLSNYATTGDLNNASGILSGAIDYVSGAAITAHQDLSYISGQVDNKLDTTAFSTVSGTFLTEHQIIPSAKWEEASTEYEQNSGTYLTAHQDISNKLDTTAFSTVSGSFLTAVDLTPYYTTADANTLSSMLSGAIDYVSANAGDEFPASADEAIIAYQTNSGTYLTAHQDLSYISGQIDNKLDLTAFNIPDSASWNESTNVVQNNSAAWFDNVGDVEVNNFVYDNSATINDVNITVQTNSAQWAEGTSVDTIPVAVISPLVTGFSGESAYLGIESTALNLSSYVPVSAIGVNLQGYVSGISGREISARNALTAQYSNQAGYASRATYDSNYNPITSYYQPKLTITGDAGTITSINGSAVGASIPEGWELVAGQGIEIVDDAENNQTTISVTAAGGNPEVESYVQTNSANIDEAITTYQNASGTYLTAHQDISANEWNDCYETVESNSASWGQGGYTPTYDYTDGNLISAIDTSGLFAQGLLSGSHVGRNIVWDGVNAGLAGSQMWLNPSNSHFAITTGIYSPLYYATGATITYGASGTGGIQTYGGFFKGNELFISDASIGQSLRAETHKNRGVHLSGATSAGYGFDLSISAVSGKNDTANGYNWKLERGCVSGKGILGEWRYGPEEDTVLRTNSGNWQDITAYQNASATYLTAVDLTPYTTTAEVDSISSMLSGAIDYVSANAGDEFPASANEAITAYQTNSGDYQTTAGMTAYQPVGEYYSASNPSGFISEIPESVTEATDYVTSTSGNINDTITNVTTNSGAWGGSALPISAGPGIKVNLVDNTLVFSNDEMVLWSGSVNLSANPVITANESLQNFERIEFIGNGYPTDYDTSFGTCFFNSQSTTHTVWLFGHAGGAGGGAIRFNQFRISASDTILAIDQTKQFSITGTANTTADTPALLTKVIGINRIAGGN